MDGALDRIVAAASATDLADTLTDAGNARRLARQYGDDVRFVPDWGWMVWSGQQWLRDKGNLGVMALAKRTIAALYRDAESILDQELRQALAKHALKSEAGPRLREMVLLAASEPGIAVPTDYFDRDAFLLNAPNGTVDLRTGQLYTHRRSDLITKMTTAPFQPDAECPAFDRFLRRIMADDIPLIKYLQRLAGYSLTGDTSEHSFYLLHGGGRNGKTTFLEVIAHALGDYASSTRPEMLMAKKHDGIPNDVARLCGSRFVYTVETENGRRLAEALVKQLTGGDTIAARFLHREFFEFAASFKIFMASNHLPVIKGTDDAIWSRVHFIPFAVRIPDDEIDPHLPEKLKAEAAGILRWAVEGCLAWQRERLNPPPVVKAATSAYRSKMDTLAPFLEECCVLEAEAWVSSSDLYKAYQEWGTAAGEKSVLTQRQLGQVLEERGMAPHRKKHGRGYSGLRLREITDPPPVDTETPEVDLR